MGKMGLGDLLLNNLIAGGDLQDGRGDPHNAVEIFKMVPVSRHQ